MRHEAGEAASIEKIEEKIKGVIAGYSMLPQGCAVVAGLSGGADSTALTHFLFTHQKEYGVSVKLFRAAAEYGDCGTAQNYLAVLYNAGAGVKKNDLAALYWFDRAVDNKEEKAVQDRKGILDAYRKNLSPEEFYNQMETLAEWCAMGSADVPKDAKKAEYWRRMSELC